MARRFHKIENLWYTSSAQNSYSNIQTSQNDNISNSDKEYNAQKVSITLHIKSTCIGDPHGRKRKS